MISWSVFAGVVVIGIALRMLFFPVCNGIVLRSSAFRFSESISP